MLQENLLESQVNEIKRVWFDHTQGEEGNISRTGLLSIFLVLGQFPSEDEIKEYIPEEEGTIDIVQFETLIKNKIKDRQQNYVIEKDTEERVVLTKDYLIFLKDYQKLSFDDALAHSNWGKNTFLAACRFHKITFPTPHPPESTSIRKRKTSAPKVPKTAGISVAIVLRKDQDQEEGKVINVEPTDITSLTYFHERIKRSFKLDPDAYSLEYKSTDAATWTVLDEESDVKYMIKHITRDTRVHIIKTTPLVATA